MEPDTPSILSMLESMNGTRWVILGIILLVIELVTGTTYILWPAAAALIIGLVVYVLPLGWEVQFILYFLLSAVLLVVGHVYVRPKMKGGEPSDLNDRARSMIGIQVKAIADFDMGAGRVQVGDTQWRAACDTATVKAGDALRVLHVKGTTLWVEPSDS